MTNYKLLVDTAALAGEIMLSSGAETYRVEDTMCHILKTSNSDSIEALALMTGIVVTVNDKSLAQPITMMKTVNDRTTNMSNIIKVNDISRKYCGQQITLEEAYERLQSVRGKQYNRTLYNLGTIGIATGFSMMLGGRMQEVVITTIVGALLAAIITIGKITKWNGIMVHALSGIGMAMLTIACKGFLIPDLDIDIVIVSAIMPIVPGVAITNAIRDTLQADYLSGCARILEAFLTAASIAVGIGLGMVLINGLMGGGVL
ncbi:MAG: threonine/serine exporter family protein [Tyzzerella sp.]|nr:threonine/serine exporter family protein [Tyzzerella sp.]